MKLAIVTPVYNDWECFNCLLQDINKLDLGPDVTVRILAVNDGSAVPSPILQEASRLHQIDCVEVIHLIRNLGHQRAIAVGLTEVFLHTDADVALVMDADGEDRPSDLVRLLAAHQANSNHVILAVRARRTEGLRFLLFYRLYKFCFRVLTGMGINFGNFSLIPRPLLNQLVYNGDLWNHLAATLMKSRFPLVKVPTDRGVRYTGSSKMKLTSLILHGLSAISVYSEIVFVRMLIASVIAVLLSLFGVAAVIGVKYTTDLAIPGWTTTAVGLLLLFAFQAITSLGGLTFTILGMRSQPFLIPLHEAQKLVREREVLVHQEQQADD